MVMDVLDALEHRTRFDEFILLSGDSDFTPLLLRLRAYDRRTAILAVGVAAAAYRAACDVMLTEETFIEQALQITGQDDGLLPDRAGVPPRPAATASLPPALRPVAARPTAAPGTVAEREQRRRDGAQVIAHLVAQSPLPIPSGTVAQKLLERFGTGLRESDWDGAGGFREFVEGLGDSRFSVSWAIPGYFYDPNRHRLPEAHQVVAQGIDLGDDTLSELAVRIHELTDTPLLTSAQFGAVFRAIAEEVNAHG